MGSLADCLKSTTVDKDTSARIRKLARKYAKTMPPAEADRRAAAELLDAAMSDMETLRSQLVGLGYDVAVQGGLSQVSPDVARSLNYETKMPDDPLFAEAVSSTPGAQLTPDGLLIDLTRYQKEEQEGASSVRTGVFYLPTGSAQERYYKGGKSGYGGLMRVQGEALIRRPLFAKGATGGKAPEAAYNMLKGKKAYENMRSDVLRSISGFGKTRQQRVDGIQSVLEKYGATTVSAYEIEANSQEGNQLAYAVQENIVAHAVREAGYDSVVGYSKKKGGGAFISEVFDVRETIYPFADGETDINPAYYQQDISTAGATTASEAEEAARQWAEMGTESPYFKKWFGDSKVVDEQGKPLVVYHGTTSRFDAFEERPPRKGNASTFGPGFYFATNRATTEAFSSGKRGRVIEAYVSIKNPFIPSVEAVRSVLENAFDLTNRARMQDGMEALPERMRENWMRGARESFEASLQKGGSISRMAILDFVQQNQGLIRAGYDGILAGGEVVAFSPTQIKSVFNRGTFDATDPRILYQSAFHGSPYRFDKFTLDAIGSGEGAQAFGWGLYFAGKKEVAEWYREELTRTRMKPREARVLVDGEPIGSVLGISDLTAIMKAKVLTALDIADGDVSKAELGLQEQIRGAEDLSGPLPGLREKYAPAFSFLASLRSKNITIDRTREVGQLYEVDIPEDDVMLHWDEPLSKQPEKVREALGFKLKKGKINPDGMDMGGGSILLDNRKRQADPNQIQPWVLKSGDSMFGLSQRDVDRMVGEQADATGSNIYTRLTAERGGQREASEYLNSLGIKGIKYLDGTSRADGDGSYNYVIFDDAAVEILNTFYQATYDPDFPRVEEARQAVASWRVISPGDTVSGLTVRGNIDNQSSIGASLDDYEIVGLREVPMNIFDVAPGEEKLAGKIRESGELSPLIVVVDGNKDGIAYILEGSHRIDAAATLGLESIPALVVIDNETMNPTLEQNRWTVPSGAQGMISFGTRSGKPLIQLFESANESTFLHETGHLYLEMIRAMATQPNAPAPIVQIWNDTKAALGMESDDLSVKDHENWARNLEAYFAEGKTPSLGLRKLFTRYAEWLKNIYREVERIFTISGTQMNGDLRPIFDRLFATEQEIKETEAFYEAQKPYFTAADQMAEEDRKKYDRLLNKAVESTHDKRLRQLTEASVKAQGGREAFTAEAREQVDRMPVYNAIASARAEGGIDADTLDELVGEKMRKELAKRWNKIGGEAIVVESGGVDPEMLAARHGYESALSMVQDMLASPSKTKMVKDIVDNRVAQEREKIARGLLDGGTLPADEAYHNEDRMALLLAEFTLLADTMSKSAGARARAIDLSAVREVAKQTLKGYTVSDATDYMRFSRSERKAAIEARLAKEKGDATKALEAKRREMLNHTLFLESMQIRKDIAKIEAFMKRTAKQKNLGEDARELARGIGIQYGVIPFKGLTGDKAWQAYGAWFAEQEKERQTLEAWASRYADLYAPYFDPYILSNAGATSYRDLTVEQFVSLRNAVDTIKAVDKQERTIHLAGEAQEKEAFIRELSSTLTNLKPKPQTRSYKKNKARKAIASYLANHIKAETLLQYLDNWNPDGPWSRLYRALADAEAEQTTRLKPASEELRRIFSPIKKNLGKTVTLPALNDSFTRGELFVAFLNMGNEGNLLRLKEGYGWTDAQLEAIKNELTKEEMDAAQAVWDFIDTFREESFAVEKRMNGRTPERVVPVPVATRNGASRGGYFPISYDADLSETAFLREQKDLDQTLFGGRNYGAAQTKQGHLKERAAGGGGQAIALDLSVITNHVYNVVHDITHREAVVNVAKIIKDPEVKGLMETYLGVEGYREMWPWLQSVARDVQEPMNQLHRWARWARKGTTIMQMGLKVTTMIQQPLGILQTVDVIGKEYAMRGLTYMYGQPSKFPEKARLVMEKSKFMENRVQAFDRDVRDAMKGLTLRDSVMQEVERFAYKGIGMAQMGVDLPTWWGAYEKAMQVEHKDVQDVDAREKKAIAYADSAVRTSQGSGSTLDLSRIQRGGEFQRLLTMFYSYFNTLYNLTYRRAKQTTGYKDVPQLAASAMLLWFLPAVLSDLVSGRGPDDDDEWLSWAAQKIGLYPLQMLVGVRDVANAAFGEFGYQLTPAESAPKSIVNWFKAVKKAIEEGEPERLVKPTAEAIGFIAHLPLKQPIITVGNIWDYATGKDSEFQARDLFFPKQESRRR